MFWLVDGKTGKVFGWASNEDTRDRILKDNPDSFVLEEEEDDCLTKGLVAVFSGNCEDEWSGIAVRNNKFVVERVTDDARMIKVICDSWYNAIRKAQEWCVQKN